MELIATYKSPLGPQVYMFLSEYGLGTIRVFPGGAVFADVVKGESLSDAVFHTLDDAKQFVQAPFTIRSKAKDYFKGSEIMHR